MSEIESCITSFVDGRVRLRHPSLKRAEDAEQVRGFLASLPGILRVTVNSRTGSLLLEYDPDQDQPGGLVGPCRAVGGFRLRPR